MYAATRTTAVRAPRSAKGQTAALDSGRARMKDEGDRLPAPTETVRLAGLLDRVGRARDREAYRAVFDHFAPRVRTFLINRRLTNALAEELTQEVMLTVWRRAATYDRSKASAATWIYTIARNLHIDHFRKESRAQRLDESDPQLLPDAPPDADELISRSQEADAVSAALAELPADQIDVLSLAFREGLSHSEISERLGLPLGTVKSRVRLAMTKLRQTLGELE